MPLFAMFGCGGIVEAGRREMFLWSATGLGLAGKGEGGPPRITQQREETGQITLHSVGTCVFHGESFLKLRNGMAGYFLDLPLSFCVLSPPRWVYRLGFWPVAEKRQGSKGGRETSEWKREKEPDGFSTG